MQRERQKEKKKVRRNKRDEGMMRTVFDRFSFFPLVFFGHWVCS